MESYVRKSRMQLKAELVQAYNLAGMIGHQVAAIFGDKHVKPPELWELHPDLFAEEKGLCEERQRQADLDLHKAKMIDHALRHNGKRGKGGGEAWKEQR